MTRRVSPSAGRSLPWQGMDEDRRNALLLYALIGAVVVFVLALISYGYYRDRIAPRHETVLKVGSRKFDVAFLQRRVAADVKTGNTQARNIQELVVGSLQSIELEEVSRQTAKDAGLAPTEDDIDAAIKQRLGVPAGSSRNVFAAAYRFDVLRVGLPVNEYREIIAAQIVEERLIKQYKDAVPGEGEQVDGQLIRTSAESTAKTAKARLDAGEKFNLVALDASIDATKEAGGEVGWVTREELTPKVAAALFTLPIGQISDPIQDRGGWYIILARGREVREIDGAQKSRIASATFSNALGETRERIGSASTISEDQILDIGRAVLNL